MFTIHIVHSADIPAPVAIVAKQAGGCTTSELPRENEREARAAARRKYPNGRNDWKVLRYVGIWENREAAAIIAEAINKEEIQ